MYLYFVQSATGGLIKIGVAVDPVKRLKQLQACSPIKLKFAALVKGGYGEERDLHRRFHESRKHGEWFEPTRELLDLIEQIGVNEKKGAEIQERLICKKTKALELREKGMTMEAIGKELNVSRQRVHQLIKTA